jgi:DHA2 family lincomycin resistance protein-like MFS transporter
MGMVFLKSFEKLEKPKLDVLSVFLSTIGFGGLIFSICSMESMGFLNMTVLTSLFFGLLGLVVFIKRQFILKEPMLELRAFRYPIFTIVVIIINANFFLIFWC